MDCNDTVLSDVHMLIPFLKGENSDFAYTRFYIRQLTIKDEGDDDTTHDAMQDDEGDFIVDRQPSEHKLATVLKDVGLQVWRGALLLAEFILDNEHMFSECCAIELGAGVGLCSIVTSRVATTVFCTDFREDILRICQTNADINAHICKNARGKDSVVKVRKFDWTKGIAAAEEKGDDYNWSQSDVDELNGVSVVLAADVIYEDHLTDVLFKQVVCLLQNNPKVVCFLSIEKRLNFTLDDLDVACPAYDHFIQTIQTLVSDNIVQARQIPAEFAQYLDYQRVKELELWEIRTAC